MKMDTQHGLIGISNDLVAAVPAPPLPPASA